MAVDVSKMSKNYKNYKDKSTKSKDSAFNVPADSFRFVYQCPPMDNMDELPYVQNLYHNRQIEKGSGDAFSKRCVRNSYDDDVSMCPACVKWAAFRKKRVEKDDEWDKQAQKYSARRKFISQVIDITPLFNTKGERVKDLKKCFLKYGKVEGCEECFLNEVCERGVQKWYMPLKCWEEFNDHYNDEGDISDPAKAIPIRISRTGSGRTSTKYSTKAFAKSSFEFTENQIARINKNLIDLVSLDPKTTAKGKELELEFKRFFENQEAEEGDDEDDFVANKKSSKNLKKSKSMDDDDDDEPVKASPKKKHVEDDDDDEPVKASPKKKHVEDDDDDLNIDDDDDDDKPSKKSIPSKKKRVVEEDDDDLNIDADDDDGDDEDSKSKKKSNIEELRKSLKNKAKAGKLNRKDEDEDDESEDVDKDEDSDDDDDDF